MNIFARHKIICTYTPVWVWLFLGYLREHPSFLLELLTKLYAERHVKDVSSCFFLFRALAFLFLLLFAALQYQWYKDADINNTISNVFTKTLIASNFIRPDLNTYTFISYNGNLYFSEVQFYDAGMYYCVVTLNAPVGYRMSTSQPPSRTSKGIELKVGGSRK